MRRDWAIAPFRYVGTEKSYWEPTEIYQRNVGKWRREYEVLTPKSKNVSPQNFPLLRYSDVLLMFAEAENELNGPTAEAHAALNQVRERAQASLFVDDQAITNKETFFEVIMSERSRELCFELHRKNDLIRWGKFIDKMKDMAAEITSEAPGNLRYGALAGNNVSERHILFPIPVREIALNRALTQNPGW